MARRLIRIRPLALAAVGAAACLTSVGGFQLWQAAAARTQAAAAQEAAAVAWAAAPDDSRAIARLSDASHQIELYVMPDASLESLAEGPGLFAGVAPGEPGLSVVAGHRETHFAFLRDLATGDRLTVERTDGARTAFQVTDARVVDGRTVVVGGGDARGGEPRLMLVTCWPFDSVNMGPERYVVTLAGL